MALTSRDATADDSEVQRVTSRTTTVLVLAAWVILIVVANRWGQWLVDAGHQLRIHAPPIIGRFESSLGWKIVIPLGAATAVVWQSPVLARRLSWRGLLAVSTAVAAAWAVSLALVDGWYWLQRPMELTGHYLHDVVAVESPGAFLSSFIGDINEYGVHVRAHPPLFVLLLWGLDTIGLSGSGWAAAAAIAGGAAAVPAVLVAVREVSSEDVARRTAPFVVLAPVALYVATTADAFFAGVGAWAVALVVVASGRRDRTGDWLGVAGGVLFGLTAMLSYGLVLLVLVPLAVCASRRYWRPLIGATIGGVVVIAGFWLAGFWWVEGLFATRIEYLESVASQRPYLYFLLANLAALSLVVGPATWVGLSRVRDRGIRLLVAGGLGAVLLAGLSGMSKGEVERIWLPFAVWILPACAALWPSWRTNIASVRVWLGLQAVVAIGVQLSVRTHW